MARRLACIVVALALATSLGLGGCRSSEQDKQPPPGGPDGGDRPQTGLPSPGQGGSETLTGPLTPPAPGGVDALDDSAPEVQNLFPKSGQVGEWTKITPVRKYEDVADMVGAENAGFYRAYGVAWSADMQYQLGRDPTRALVVQLFRCRDSGDACGLMSISSDMPAGLPLGQEARSGPFVRLHVWSGPFYLHLFSDRQQGPAFVSAMHKLAESIVANLAADGVTPSLVQRLPKRDRLAGRVHYFKGPASLASTGLVSLDGYMEELAALLQFDANDQLVIAAYRTPDMPEPTLMFVARYGSAAMASEAHRRLDAAAIQSASFLGRNLLTHPSTGQFLFGTLTPPQYSRQLAAARSAPAAEVAEMPVFPTFEKRFSGQ